MTELTLQTERYRSVSHRLRPESLPPKVKFPPHLRDTYVSKREMDELQGRIADLAEALNIKVSTLSTDLGGARKQIAVLEMALDDSKAVALPSPMRWKRILIEVSRATGITVPQILGRRRSVLINEARQACMYRLSTETTMSLLQIGRRLGGRDHTTIHHGIQKHCARMKAELQ